MSSEIITDPIPTAAPRGVSSIERPAQRVRPVRLIIGGVPVAGAEFIQPPHSAAFEDAEVGRGLALIEGARGDGIQLLYASPGSPGSQAILERIGFERRFEVQHRHVYIGVGSLSKRLDAGLDPVRSFARYAVRMRQCLMEVEWSEGWLGQCAQLFARRRPHCDFAVDRDVEYLRTRYAADPRYRLLVLRRRAGTGIDAFIVVRVHRYKGERQRLELIDHWTRERDKKAMAWLIGELAMWGMAERCDLIQAFAAVGSPLDQTLVAASALRKKDAAAFMVKRIDQAVDVGVDAERTQLRAGDLAHY